jgi:hypothetical protein
MFAVDVAATHRSNAMQQYSSDPVLTLAKAKGRPA